MCANTTPTLTEAMRAKYPQESNDRQRLVIGKYHVTRFEMIPSEKYESVAYLDTKEGNYRTTSRNVVGQLKGNVGATLNEIIEKHGVCELEIVDRKATTGRNGIAIKAF